MRIVAGSLRGRPLAAPSGKTTRPTTDRARETLFNILEHADWAPPFEDARILDVFAGSGALGLEALSRGGAFAAFIEMAPAARAALSENISALGVEDRTQSLKRDATRPGPLPEPLAPGFDLVFLDPPYGKGLVPKALAGLVRGGWLQPRALCIAETAAEETLEIPGWDLLDTRKTGAARFHVLRGA